MPTQIIIIVLIVCFFKDVGKEGLRRTSSVPNDLSRPSSESLPIVIQDIEAEEFTTFDSDDDPFSRGDIRRSTRRIKDRIRT